MNKQINNTGMVPPPNGEKYGNDLVDDLDLMCDEFQRIKALICGRGSEAEDMEILSLCNRAIKHIKVNFPIVELCDNLEKENSKLKAKIIEKDQILKMFSESVKNTFVISENVAGTFRCGTAYPPYWEEKTDHTFDMSPDRYKIEFSRRICI